jgi:hypothetical protein
MKSNRTGMKGKHGSVYIEKTKRERPEKQKAKDVLMIIDVSILKEKGEREEKKVSYRVNTVSYRVNTKLQKS